MPPIKSALSDFERTKTHTVSAKLLIPFSDSRYDIFYGSDIPYTNHIKYEQQKAMNEVAQVAQSWSKERSQLKVTEAEDRPSKISLKTE